MNETLYIELKKTAAEDRDKKIAAAKAEYAEALAGIEYVWARVKDRKPEPAQQSQQRPFLPNLPDAALAVPTTTGSVSTPVTQGRERGEIVNVIRHVIEKDVGYEPFTAEQIAPAMDASSPNLGASKNVRKVTASLGRMVKSGELMVVSEGRKGSPQVYRKATDAERRGGAG